MFSFGFGVTFGNYKRSLIGRVKPSFIGVVEKPLVGRMAFTPLTRGARGVGFQPREGERNG